MSFSLFFLFAELIKRRNYYIYKQNHYIISLPPIVNRETYVSVYKGSQRNIEARIRKFLGKIARKTHNFEKRKPEEYRRLYLYFGTPEESSSTIEMTPTGLEMNLQINSDSFHLKEWNKNFVMFI